MSQQWVAVKNSLTSGRMKNQSLRSSVSWHLLIRKLIDEDGSGAKKINNSFMYALQLNNKKPLTIPCTQQEEGDRHDEQNPENSAELAGAQIFDHCARHLAISHNNLAKANKQNTQVLQGIFLG